MRRHVCLSGLTLFALTLPTYIYAQSPVDASEDNVVINFPDQIDLRILVDYTGKALDLRFLYGEELANRKVELRPSPITVPKAKLLELLTSLLRVRELALIQEDEKLYRIVRSDQITRNVSTILPQDATIDPQSWRMVTQVLEVPGADVKSITEKLGPFLSSPKSSLLPLPESQRVIVTDYEARIALLTELIRHLTSVAPDIGVHILSLPNADAAVLAEQITAIFVERQRVRKDTAPPPSLRVDILPGRLVLVGTQEQFAETRSLVAQLAPAEVTLITQGYQPQFLSVERITNLIDSILLAPGSELPKPVRITTDEGGARLFVTAEQVTHAAIAELLEREDVPYPAATRPMRTYRPRHRKADTLLATISQLLGQSTSLQATDASSANNGSNGTSGPNHLPNTVGQLRPEPPAQGTAGSQSSTAQRIARVVGPDYVITVDQHTNAIIAVGTREFHAQLTAMIEELDIRRPQVLVEMNLVAITYNDSLDLGVELEAVDLGEAWDYLAFTSFGLSEIDVLTGQRTLIPGLGGNGILLRPDQVPIILRTLATKANARVVSTPKLLVSDNATGTLRNVDEAPFTSVNASDTVATTSFAGFESAGTTLTVTPHIAEGDHLTLEYELTFSNFSGGSSNAAVPPPRTTNSFTSTVEVPDGYTLITGGLIVENTSDSLSEIPLLGRIPGLGVLFQSSNKRNTKTKIFAFIRPVIVRDDEFEALKYMTLKDVELAELQLQQSSTESGLWMR